MDDYGDDDNPFKVIWDCPCCKSQQTDWFDSTVLPLCGDCLTAFDWDEIVSPALLRWLNDALALVRTCGA